MTKKPWTKVENPEYFLKILDNMSKYEYTDIVVRFGLMGKKHVRPNYQIEFTSEHGARTVRAYNGNGHGRASARTAPAGAYRDANLSEQRFTLAEVQELWRGCKTGKFVLGPNGD